MSESAGQPEDKREALEAVLKSGVFLRADQLRSFLRYVCEMELAGRGEELNEYRIGVEALGKPPGYSTAEDAAVRRRAHELREKLDEAYASELAAARLRIELPKGRYVPKFVPRPEEPAAPVAAAPAPAEAPPAAGASLRGWLAPVAWMAVGGAVAFGVARLSPSRTPDVAIDPVLAEAWGPLVVRGASVTLAVASPAHFNVLPYPDGPLPPGVRLVPDDWALVPWYTNHYPLKPGHKLGLHLSGPLRSGEVMGMLAATRVLTRAHADVQVVIDKKLPISAVRGRNLVFFGNPEYSDLAGALLEGAAWTVDYDSAGRARILRPQKEGSAYKTYAPEADWQRRSTFGLITVLPNAESVVPQERDAAIASRAVVVSCTNSQGCQAAADFFASASRMSELRDRFRAEGQAGFPPAYQVVVRCDLHLSQPVAGGYEAHAVLAAR
jgi:hypothetical protein